MLPPTRASARLSAVVQSPGGKIRPPVPSPQTQSHEPGANPTILFRTLLSRGHCRRREQETEYEDLSGRHAARAPRRGVARGAGAHGRAHETSGPRNLAGGMEGARRGTRESASRRPWQDAPAAVKTTRARRGTTQSGSAAGRSGPTGPGGPASRRQPGAAHLCPPVPGGESPPWG